MTTPGPTPWQRLAASPWALLSSLFLLMVGAGLEGSLLGLRATSAGFDVRVTGVILGGYYLGYVVGSVLITSGIKAIGHIRVYAGLASVASVVTLAHSIWVAPLPWLVLRFVSGVCLAGLFVVVESWLNAVAEPGGRAQLLGLYMAVLTVGLALGQGLLNAATVDGDRLFTLAAVLFSLAVVPIALVPHHAPAAEDVRSYALRRLVTEVPLAMVASAVSGVGAGITLGFGAVYAAETGFDVGGASAFITAILVGAAIGQRPLGLLSDHVDRRVAIAAAGLIVTAAAVVGFALTGADALPAVIVCGALAGAGVFPLYSLALAHLADHTDADELTAGGTRLILVNGLGAAVGPVVVGVMIRRSGPGAFFLVLALVHVALTLYAGVRMVRGQARPRRRVSYAPLPSSATPEVLELEAEVLIDDVDPRP